MFLKMYLAVWPHKNAHLELGIIKEKISIKSISKKQKNFFSRRALVNYFYKLWIKVDLAGDSESEYLFYHCNQGCYPSYPLLSHVI